MHRCCNRNCALALAAAWLALAGYALVWRATRPALTQPQPRRYDWGLTGRTPLGYEGEIDGSDSAADNGQHRAGGGAEPPSAVTSRRFLVGVGGDSGGVGGGGDPFAHNREYRVLIECDNICQTGRLFLIVLVCSRPENVERRAALRRTWASVRDHRGQAVRTVFVLGRPAAAAAQANVSAESAAWGDVLQVDVDESYRNLTIKTLLGLRFALASCGHAQFVMKTDDDVVANYRNVVDYLLGLSVADARHLYAGSVHNGTRPQRDPTDKWHVSVAEYAREFYPPYAGGSGYVLSVAAAALVVRASRDVRYLVMEDAFVGLCAERAGVTATHDKAFQGYWFKPSVCRLRALFTSHGWEPDEMEEAWRLMLSVEPHAEGDSAEGVTGTRRSSAPPPPSLTVASRRACPPLNWLLYHYEDTDDEVDRKYRADAEDEPVAASDDDGDSPVPDYDDGGS